eukprot:PhM_4_TR1353/c1_g1_i2/m.44081
MRHSSHSASGCYVIVFLSVVLTVVGAIDVSVDVNANMKRQLDEHSEGRTNQNDNKANNNNNNNNNNQKKNNPYVVVDENEVPRVRTCDDTEVLRGNSYGECRLRSTTRILIPHSREKDVERLFFGNATVSLGPYATKVYHVLSLFMRSFFTTTVTMRGMRTDEAEAAGGYNPYKRQRAVGGPVEFWMNDSPVCLGRSSTATRGEDDDDRASKTTARLVRNVIGFASSGLSSTTHWDTSCTLDLPLVNWGVLNGGGSPIEVVIRSHTPLSSAHPGIPLVFHAEHHLDLRCLGLVLGVFLCIRYATGIIEHTAVRWLLCIVLGSAALFVFIVFMASKDVWRTTVGKASVIGLISYTSVSAATDGAVTLLLTWVWAQLCSEPWVQAAVLGVGVLMGVFIHFMQLDAYLIRFYKLTLLIAEVIATGAAVWLNTWCVVATAVSAGTFVVLSKAFGFVFWYMATSYGSGNARDKFPSYVYEEAPAISSGACDHVPGSTFNQKMYFYEREGRESTHRHLEALAAYIREHPDVVGRSHDPNGLGRFVGL